MARVREGLLIVALAIALPSAAWAAATRVAVIGEKGKSTLADFVVPTIEAGLSKESQVTLVERALINKVLAEQQLSAAGLMEPSKAIQVGQILGVDMFLVVDAPPPPPALFEAAKESVRPTCRIRAVEARTGIILCSCMQLQETLLTDLSGVTSLIDLASRKLGYAPNNRRYVALLVFRSEALDDSLDSLADMLSMFLLNDLANSPNVIVLERERLEHLTAEKTLAGAEVALRTSAVLLKGGLAYGATRNEVVATVELQSLNGDKTEYVHINGSLENLAGLRTQMVSEIAEKLNSEPAGLRTLSPAEEAKLFMNQAETESAFGTDGVIARTQAAVALDPSDEIVARAKGMYFRVALYDTRAYDRELPMEARTHATIEGLHALVLYQKAQYQGFRDKVLSRWEKNHEVDEGELCGNSLSQIFLVGGHDLYVNKDLYGYRRAVRETGSAEARQLFAELQQAWLRQYREAMAIATEICRTKGTANVWMDLLAERLRYGHDIAGSAEEWLASIQEVVGQIENPPPGAPRMTGQVWKYVPLKYAMEACFPRVFNNLLPSEDPKAAYSALYPGIQEAFHWLMNHPDPVVRFATYAAAFQDGWGYSKDAETCLQMLAREIPAILPGEKENPLARDGLWAHRWMDIFLWTYNNDPDLLIKYGDAILRPMLRLEHARLASEWNWANCIKFWLSAFENEGRFREAYEIAKDFQDTVNVTFPPNLDAQGDAKSHIGFLERQLGLAAPPAPKPQAPDLRPEQFVVKLLTTETGYRVNAIQPDGNRAVLLEAGSEGDQGDRVRLVAVPLDGGNRSILGEIMLKPAAKRNLHCTAVLTRDEAGQWLASMSDIGIVTFEKGKTRLWTEADGLPSLKLTSFACLNGKWYLGTSPGAIVEFDPKTGRSATLCSCRRSEAPQNLFDGLPTYDVPYILSDPVRNCIWFGINNTQGHETRRGLWKFDAASRKISFASERLEHIERAHARWCFDRILIQGIGLYDPATDSICYLTEHAYTRSKKDPWPCGPVREYWPVGVFGDKIICEPDPDWPNVISSQVKVEFFNDQPPLTLRAQDILGQQLLAVECRDAVVIAGEDSTPVFAVRDKGGAPSFERLEEAVKRSEAEVKRSEAEVKLFREQMKRPPPITGPQGTPVPQRAVISFDQSASTGEIRVGYNPVFNNMTKAMTAEAWIWADDPTHGEIMTRDTPKLGPWQLRITLDGKLESDVAPANWNPSPESTYRRLPTRTWLHIAMVFDGRELRNYINGHKVSACPEEPQLTTNDNNLLIGRFFNGRIAGARLSSEALYKEDFTPPARLTKLPSTVMLLPLDEGQGITAEDESGNGCIATIVNGTWMTVPVDEFQPDPAHEAEVKQIAAETRRIKEQMRHPPPKPGPQGTLVPQRPVISFDGNEGEIAVQYNPVFNMTKAMTAEAWIWADDPARGIIMTRDTPKLGPWQLRITPDGKLESDVAPFNWKPSPENTYYPLPTKTWLHIAMVFDGQELRNYINGRKVSACAEEPQLTTNDNNLLIGRRFNGRIAGARLSNEALYKEDFTPPIRLTKLPSTVMLLPLDEGQGSTAEDESGNGCVAVIAHGTWITVPVDEFQVNAAAAAVTPQGNPR